MTAEKLDEKTKNIVGMRIKKLRIEKMISQKQLSDMVNSFGHSMTPSTLSKIERSKRGITDVELYAFAQSLDISVGELFAEL